MDKDNRFKAVPSVDALLDDGVHLFLVYDFDGVFNSLKTTGTYKKTFYNPTHRERHPNPHYMPPLAWEYNSEPKSYLLQWSSEVVDAVNGVASRDDVQVVWLSTWREHMSAVCDRLGLTSVREQFFLPWGSDVHSPQGMKIDALQEWFGESSISVGDGVKVAWVDDQVLVPAVIEENPLKGNFADEEQFLLAPDGWYGFSRSELKDFVSFCNYF